MKPTIRQLFATLPQTGRVEWIGLRTQRRAPLQIVEQVEANTESGLRGDRYSGRSGKRQVTLIQYEHLAVIAAVMGNDCSDPAVFRRNIAVSGVNLLALKDKDFQIGEAVLRYTGLCHPCSYMEDRLGPGGYNAVRGHGGITAQVVQSGHITLGCKVVAKHSA